MSQQPEAVGFEEIENPGPWIERELRRLGWNPPRLQFELASRAHIQRSLNTIKSWKRGDTTPRTWEMAVLIRVFSEAGADRPTRQKMTLPPAA